MQIEHDLGRPIAELSPDELNDWRVRRNIYPSDCTRIELAIAALTATVHNAFFRDKVRLYEYHRDWLGEATERLVGPAQRGKELVERFDLINARLAARGRGKGE